MTAALERKPVDKSTGLLGARLLGARLLGSIELFGDI